MPAPRNNQNAALARRSARRSINLSDEEVEFWRDFASHGRRAGYAAGIRSAFDYLTRGIRVSQVEDGGWEWRYVDDDGDERENGDSLSSHSEALADAAESRLLYWMSNRDRKIQQENIDMTTVSLAAIEDEKNRVRRLAAQRAARNAAHFKKQIELHPDHSMALMQEMLDEEQRIADECAAIVAALESAALTIAHM